MESRSRPLLVGSLGLLLLLILVTGASALVLFHQIGINDAALRARMLERFRTLSTIREGIYAGGDAARDYFADPNAAEASALLARLTEAERDSVVALNQYVDSSALRGEVLAYWKVLNLMKEMALKSPSVGVNAYFRRGLAERRATMLSLTATMDASLESDRRNEEAAVQAMRARFRNLMATGILVLAVLGLLVATITIRRFTRLETRTRSLTAQVMQVQEQERRAIARELHDGVGQSLSLLLLDAGKSAAARSIERMIEEVRRISLSLRPSMLDDLGLVAALEWQAREVGSRTGLHVQVSTDDEHGDLPDEQRTCIYRVVQEALHNCVRHAKAQRVTVGLRRAAQSVSLTVEDDGCGFYPSRSRGVGLLGMEERVLQVGGRFHVQSEPGRGTLIMVEIPV